MNVGTSTISSTFGGSVALSENIRKEHQITPKPTFSYGLPVASTASASVFGGTSSSGLTLTASTSVFGGVSSSVFGAKSISMDSKPQLPTKPSMTTPGALVPSIPVFIAPVPSVPVFSAPVPSAPIVSKASSSSQRSLNPPKQTRTYDKPSLKTLPIVSISHLLGFEESEYNTLVDRTRSTTAKAAEVEKEYVELKLKSDSSKGLMRDLSILLGRIQRLLTTGIHLHIYVYTSV
jgi:hypothetical protein